MRAYEAAIAGEIAPKLRVGQSNTRPRTISALVAAYYSSAEFNTLAPLTRSTYRNIIERFRVEHGDKLVSRLNREHIEALRDAKADTPAAANHFLGIIRILMRFAIEKGLRTDDPTVGIRKVKRHSRGYYTWTEADIAAFEARWPIGTRARLALTLLLYTAQRRSDVVRMGRQHLKGEKINIRQQKKPVLCSRYQFT